MPTKGRAIRLGGEGMRYLTHPRYQRRGLPRGSGSATSGRVVDAAPISLHLL